jgi:hypothetical protein
MQSMAKLDTKKITSMREGGKRLAEVREALALFTHVGTTFAEIESQAMRLIKKAGAVSKF